MKNGLITSTYNVFSTYSLMNMDEINSEEALGWYKTHPNILKATKLLGRLYNDVTTFQVCDLYILPLIIITTSR